MGAEQSSSTRDKDSQETGVQTKTCYYELLGIDRQATENEIKKAYRKKALELHPDRNYGNVENATRKFAEVQSAYQVLSDPQERAWYDSHRDAILRDDAIGEDHFEYNMKMTSAEDIVSLMSKFTANTAFTDAPDGFYGKLRTTFKNLAREEDATCDWQGLEAMDYPDFGAADDTYEDGVKHFYSIWTGFSTRKTYSWKDAYNYAEAPDRRVRRLMEKENKRLREDGVREFNDAVRSLVNFVRKRDPRYTPNSQSVAERQKLLRDAAAAQAARSRAANQAKLDGQVVPEWMKSREVEDEGLFSDSEQSDSEHYECVTCGKTFKSEKQYDSHEKSKKHIKAVQQLRRQMQKDSRRWNLDNDVSAGSTQPQLLPEQGAASPDEDRECVHSDVPLDGFVVERNASNKDSDAGDLMIDVRDIPELPQKSNDTSEESNDSGDDYAPRAEIESRLTGPANTEQVSAEPTKDGEAEDLIASIAATSIASDNESAPQRAIGKAKAKRAKKAAQQEAAAQVGHICMVCNEAFASKSKLFSHIKENSHAQPVVQIAAGSKKKKH